MNAHPSTHHEIATLRDEGRLARAAFATAYPEPATGARHGDVPSGLGLVFERVRALAGARLQRAALGVPRPLA